MSKHHRSKVLPVVGWREWIGLPELGIDWIKAKVDSGARSSCLHAYQIETFREAGKTFVRFCVHPVQRNRSKTVQAVAPLLEYRLVKSSTGHLTRRPVIVTKVQLLGRSYDVELTLASRDAMGFRMLLGRQAVRGSCVIDGGRSYLSGLPPHAQPDH